MSEFLDFIAISNPEHKTKKWLVRNIITQVYLGRVQWRTGFRKYVFTPDDSETGFDFDSGCLQRIVDFLQYETNKHYAELDNKHV